MRKSGGLWIKGRCLLGCLFHCRFQVRIKRYDSSVVCHCCLQGIRLELSETCFINYVLMGTDCGRGARCSKERILASNSRGPKGFLMK